MLHILSSVPCMIPLIANLIYLLPTTARGVVIGLKKSMWDWRSFHEAGVDCEAGEVSHTMRRCQNEYQRILEDVHVVDVPSGILI